jgi:hypothetical protein
MIVSQQETQKKLMKRNKRLTNNLKTVSPLYQTR